jgi:tetratricopeptide (TPR) repeat protein
LHYARGIAGFKQGLWKSALEDFNTAIQLIPGNAAYYKYAGACSYFLKEKENAERDLKKALGINPDDPETYYYLGLTATNLKNLPRQGYDYMTSAIELDASQADYYYQRAKSSYELTNYDAALEDVQQSLDMYQGNGNYYALRGMTRLKLKYDDEQICEDFNKAYELGTFYRIRKQYRRRCQ